MSSFDFIGKNYAPPDLVAKVTGRAKYAEDFRAEGMLFAKMLLCPMPRARVRSIDASAALALPGVVAILTADEVPEVKAPDEPALTNDPLHEGAPILAVAAVDETTAADAIERIRVELEPLPFILDPLTAMHPDAPNARAEGNVFIGREIGTIKWTKEDFAEGERMGRMPLGKPADEWAYGDLEGGFSEAALVLEESIVHPSITHHPMEPRSCMAYWQNGKLYLHDSTQSVAQTRARMATLLGLELSDVVLIAEYCGGGFGSKISGSVTELVPALLARKTGRPVLLRITREEENALGRARCGLQGWVRMGFRADGRMTALDLYLLQDNGPFNRRGDSAMAGNVASLSYQPLSMRFRGAAVFTNTPPKSDQRGPGGAQITVMLEPIVDEAARRLGLDRVEIRKINAPGSDALLGEKRTPVTSAFVKEALEKGEALFGWQEKKQLSGRREGSKVTGIGVGVSSFVGGSAGYDGLLLLRPDGTLHIHQGIGNLGTHSVMDTARAAMEVLGMPLDRCAVIWGDTSRSLPWSGSQSGSKTTYAHTRANYVAALDLKRKLQEIAARDLGATADLYDVHGGRVFRRATPSVGMTLARAAERAVQLGGKYSGHELPEDIHAMTVEAAKALAGQGALGVAKDTLPTGAVWSFVVGFAAVQLDLETGVVDVLEYAAVTDCGTVVNPRSLAAQLHGGGIQGMGGARSQKWVLDQHWGNSLSKRLYVAKPPTILDVPLEMKWAAVELPDPTSPMGAKGIGEPPVGAGGAAVACAIADALGGVMLHRTPITTDLILTALEGKRLPYGRIELHA